MRLALLLFFSLLVTWPTAQAADAIRLGVVAPDHESLTDIDTMERYRVLGEQFSAQLKIPVSFTSIYNSFTATKRASRGEYDMILAPANVIAIALKSGFAPVAKTSNKSGIVFVVANDAKWRTLEQAQGTRLALPAADSLPASLARGEINLESLEIRKHFKVVRYFRKPEAVLYALQIGAADIAAADNELAQKWLKTNSGRILQKSTEVPMLALAVKRDRIGADKDEALLAALNRFASGRSHGDEKLAFVAAHREEFAAVASTLNTTPKELPGAQIINVEQAKALQQQGVMIVDARNTEEYTAGHIKGSVLIPYTEISAKEVGFDPAEDKFDLNKLPRDKTKPIALYCDGTPCWKSYKAATLAVGNGYKSVYWFRGGFPDWKAAGMPVETGK